VVIGFSALQVVFLFEKQENVLIRALICGPKSPVWGAGFVPGLVFYDNTTGFIFQAVIIQEQKR
jgi:hypothetical protein